MGGRIAIDFALEHPDRVAAVVVVGPGLGGYRFDSAISPRTRCAETDPGSFSIHCCAK